MWVLMSWYFLTQMHIYEKMAEFITYAYGIMIAQAKPTAPTYAKNAFSLMNYFLPLEEITVLCLGYINLKFACAAIRIIKSFIPTIS